MQSVCTSFNIDIHTRASEEDFCPIQQKMFSWTCLLENESRRSNDPGVTREQLLN